MMKFSNVQYRDGVAVVTFEIPQALFSDFNNLFSSLLGVFKYSQIKARHRHAEMKAESSNLKAIRDQQFLNFEKDILKKYDEATSKGLSVRESINLVKSKINKSGDHITCYQIELICRANGRFRKGNRKNV